MDGVIQDGREIGVLHCQAIRRDELRTSFRHGRREIVCEIHTCELQHDSRGGIIRVDVAVLTFVEFGKLEQVISAERSCWKEYLHRRLDLVSQRNNRLYQYVSLDPTRSTPCPCPGRSVAQRR